MRKAAHLLLVLLPCILAVSASTKAEAGNISPPWFQGLNIPWLNIPGLNIPGLNIPGLNIPGLNRNSIDCGRNSFHHLRKGLRVNVRFNQFGNYFRCTFAIPPCHRLTATRQKSGFFSSHLGVIATKFWRKLEGQPLSIRSTTTGQEMSLVYERPVHIGFLDGLTVSLQLTRDPSCQPASSDCKQTPRRCGLIPHQQGRIVGGVPVPEHSIPWQVGLVSHVENIMWCGGTLISRSIVLTAAHCFGTYKAHQVFAVVGGHLTNGSTDGHIYAAAKVELHPLYRPDPSFDNDFALLFLHRKVDFAATHSFPACLPAGKFVNVNKRHLTASGWGVSVPDGQRRPDVLQKLTMLGISNKECEEIWRGTGNNVTNNMVCARGVNGGGTCLGDSGGPLTFKNRRGEAIVVGATSFVSSRPLCRGNLVPVFSRVSQAVGWIKSHCHDCSARVRAVV